MSSLWDFTGLTEFALSPGLWWFLACWSDCVKICWVNSSWDSSGLINTLRPKQNGCHFGDSIFNDFSVNENLSYNYNCTEICSLGSNWQYCSIGPDNGLGAKQATSHYLNQSWLDYRHIFASLGLNELTFTHTPLNSCRFLACNFSSSFCTFWQTARHLVTPYWILGVIYPNLIKHSAGDVHPLIHCVFFFKQDTMNTNMLKVW